MREAVHAAMTAMTAMTAKTVIGRRQHAARRRTVLPPPLVLLLMFLLSAAPTRLLAADIDVPGDFDTLQEALDASLPGDVIRLGPGTFTGLPGSEAVGVLPDHDLEIIGSGAGMTIIDGQSERRGLLALSPDFMPSDILIADLTITDALATTAPGGGALLNGADGGGIASEVGDLVLERVHVEGCSADRDGGAVWIFDGSLLAADCEFRQCHAKAAGAVLYALGGFHEISGGAIIACSGSSILEESLFGPEIDVSGLSAESTMGAFIACGDGEFSINDTSIMGHVGPIFSGNDYFGVVNGGKVRSSHLLPAAFVGSFLFGQLDGGTWSDNTGAIHRTTGGMRVRDATISDHLVDGSLIDTSQMFSFSGVLLENTTIERVTCVGDPAPLVTTTAMDSFTITDAVFRDNTNLVSVLDLPTLGSITRLTASGNQVTDAVIIGYTGVPVSESTICGNDAPVALVGDWCYAGLPSQVSVDCEVSCPSDLNGNGTSDLDDLSLILDDWDATVPCLGDIDFDGDVDFRDLVIVLNDFGDCGAAN